MVGWWAIAGALLLALLVLGFCTYELAGKSKRLRLDVRRLSSVRVELETAQRELMAMQHRLRRPPATR